ncbi:MAG TPA: DAHL domain-containing protein [Burkholderiales bacterium]|nr:DAHL domain-containing protein [Burkholderiales bacterium]
MSKLARSWIVLRLRRAFVRVRQRGLDARATAFIAGLLVAGLVFLHLLADDAASQRNAEVLAQLAGVKLTDARWDVAVLRARASGVAERVVQARDVARIQRTLEAAYANAHSNALRAGIEELKKAYEEKADLVTRYQQASVDAKHALDAAMRADAAIGTLVRNAWRDFTDRDRLVAAENLVARVLAEAQQYHHSPNTASRAALEGAAVDLPRAHSLPRPIETALARLESDVHQVLLLKPLEQMLGDRLAVLNTAARIDELAETYQRQLDDALAARGRYRTALAAYSLVLLLIVAIAARRIYRRYVVLQALAARSAPPRPASTVEDAELVDTRPPDEHHPGDVPNLRVINRP